MPNDRFGRDADDFLTEVWGKRVEGLPVPEFDWSGPVKHGHVEYLLNRYPFLQIIRDDPHFPLVIVPQFITAASGWIIHDYGDALSTSAGKGLFDFGNLALEDEETDEGGGKGTVIKQLFDTARDMINLAKEKGWAAVEIAAGTPLMQWAAWMAAEDAELKLVYQPTEAELAKRARILRSRQQISLTASLGSNLSTKRR